MMDEVSRDFAVAPLHSGIALRPARIEDMEQLFEWRNLPENIATATSGRPVLWVEHQRWFSESLRGDEHQIFIIFENENPLGQLRFDRVALFERVVSIYLIPRHTGRGLGVVAIRLGCTEIWRTDPLTKFTAWIRADNERSLRAFIRAGFHLDELSEQKPEHYRLSLELSNTTA